MATVNRFFQDPGQSYFLCSHGPTRINLRLKARRPVQEQKRVNVDFPTWMVHSLDKEAKRLGVPRQSIIKVWIAERLEKLHT